MVCYIKLLLAKRRTELGDRISGENKCVFSVESSTITHDVITRPRRSGWTRYTVYQPQQNRLLPYPACDSSSFLLEKRAQPQQGRDA